MFLYNICKLKQRLLTSSKHFFYSVVLLLSEQPGWQSREWQLCSCGLKVQDVFETTLMGMTFSKLASWHSVPCQWRLPKCQTRVRALLHNSLSLSLLLITAVSTATCLSRSSVWMDLIFQKQKTDSMKQKINSYGNGTTNNILDVLKT